MTPRLLRALLPFLALLLTGAPVSAQEKILRWHDDLGRGAEAARASGKPLFVVFRCVR
jgi:hypothetical protein